METIVCSVFDDSKAAGEAVSMLKAKGYTESISVVHRDETTGEAKTQNVSQNLKDGTAVGAGTGLVAGAISALLVGAASFVIPGAGLVVLGPLATLLSGAAAGAVTGGVVGALVDKGIPEDQAKWYESAVMNGQTLVSVAVDDSKRIEVEEILTQSGGNTAEVER